MYTTVFRKIFLLREDILEYSFRIEISSRNLIKMYSFDTFSLLRLCSKTLRGKFYSKYIVHMTYTIAHRVKSSKRKFWNVVLNSY